MAQTAPGGKILTTLGGWLFGYARVLLTVHADGTAEGPLLPGTVSFMAARSQTPPALGNPVHWAPLADSQPRPIRHHPDRITAGNDEAFFARFLVQGAVPDAQLTWTDQATYLIDLHSGSIAEIRQDEVCEGGPLRLWDRAERALDAWDDAGRPGPEAFRLCVDASGQHLRHPGMPDYSVTGTALA